MVLSTDIFLNSPKRCKYHVYWISQPINITTDGRKHLEVVVGSDTCKVQYAEELADDCNVQLKLLSTIAKNQPQAAYLDFVNGFRSKLNYFMRISPEISHHLVSLEETLRNRFKPAITGGHISNSTWKKVTYSFWWTCNPYFL